jgi:hypothetical protein
VDLALLTVRLDLDLLSFVLIVFAEIPSAAAPLPPCAHTTAAAAALCT